MALVAAVYLALALSRRFEVVADELAAFGAGMRIYTQGPLTQNLVEQLFINPYLVAGLASLIGPERAFVAARVVQGLFGLVTLLGTAALAYRLTGRPWVGTLAAALLATAPFFVRVHHLLRMDVPETTGFVLTLLALSAWLRRPNVGRFLLSLAAAALMVGGKLLGIIFLPGLVGVAVAWGLRRQGGVAFVGGLIACLWLFWVLPQTFVIRLGLGPEEAQARALQVSLVCAAAVAAVFAPSIVSVLRRVSFLVAGLLVALVLLAGLAASPLGRDRQQTYQALVTYQLQRVTIGLDEGHPGNLDRFPEGYIWYINQWVHAGFLPETVALAGAGAVALIARRRASPGRRLITQPGGELLLLLPLVSGFAFVGGGRSWFLRYSLPLFPIIAILAAIGAWDLTQRLIETFESRWRKSGRRGLWRRWPWPARRTGVAVALLLIGGLLIRNVVLIEAQTRAGIARGAFFSLREPFGQQVRPGDVVLADHESSWIWDSGLFLQPPGAYPLMMLGLPRDVTLINARAHGSRIADWLVTDRPIDWPTFRQVFEADASGWPGYFEPGVTRYHVYRNLYGVEPDERVRLDVRDLMAEARVENGLDAGRLVYWNFDARRHQVVFSHPGAVPSEIAIPLQVQPGDALRGSYGFNPEAPGQGSDGATVRIRLRSGDRERVILADDNVPPPPLEEPCGPWNVKTETCTPETALPKHRWSEFSIDLSEYAGRNLEIVLETGPGPRANYNFDWTGWGDLRVVSLP